MLLERKFLIERPDERLDFSHQVVRQAVYDSLNILQRRRLHLAVAGALVDLHQDTHSPSEVAMHYSQSGASYRLLAAEYNVRAGERLLRTYGFRQAIETFDRVLKTFEEVEDSPPPDIRRALEGLGLAYESMFDAEGVTNTYRKLQSWARKQGDRPLMIAKLQPADHHAGAIRPTKRKQRAVARAAALSGGGRRGGGAVTRTSRPA